MSDSITVDSDEYTQLLCRWGELYLLGNERTPDEEVEMQRLGERMEVAEIAKWRQEMKGTEYEQT